MVWYLEGGPKPGGGVEGGERRRGARRCVDGHTLPLAPLRWAKEVPSEGAPVSPRISPWTALDFLLRRAVASCDVERGLFAAPSSGKGSEPDPVAAMMGVWRRRGARGALGEDDGASCWQRMGSKTRRRPDIGVWFVDVGGQWVRVSRRVQKTRKGARGGEKVEVDGSAGCRCDKVK